MGIYSEYLDKKLNWPDLSEERKKQLKRIAELRGRAVLTFAAALTKQGPISIDYDDRVPFFDQLENLRGDKIDIILETPGGYAEVAEDLVEQVRNRFSYVGVIIPGYAKSAGTIMVMAADEILMEPCSALGPIDAQITQGGKRYSAHAFLQGLDKIKDEVDKTGRLNRAYIPILQNISPGEIQSCENSMNFSESLVTKWLSNYKFKIWNTHSSTGKKVTTKDKERRAKEIAKKLCDHGKWLTHGRSIGRKQLEEMRLKIEDYSKNNELCDAIRRYYVLLKMSFDSTEIFKIYETPDSQIYRFERSIVGPGKLEAKFVIADIECGKCKTKTKLQANFEKGVPIQNGVIPFPKGNEFICPNCGNTINLNDVRRRIEAEVKKRIL